jgi:hypothetical protein
MPSPDRTAPNADLPARVILAVNGGLMRGMKDYNRMLAAGGEFVRDGVTAPVFRLWSIRDDHPAMIRVNEGGSAVPVELWSLPPEGLVAILREEPFGLTLGRYPLDDGTQVIGVLGETAYVEGQREITEYGGWRAYVRAEGVDA